MERPDSGLIKWSPNAAHDSFIHINLQHRVVQVYEPTGRAQRGQFEYRKLAKHDDLPPLTTYDWSPSVPGLVAVGTSTGVVNLLRVDDNSNAYLELGLKMSRTCQAVAFNTAGKLAVALDRVRSDNCLYIWDVSRLSSIDATVSGFPADAEPPSDPIDRLEPSVSVTSVRFFEDNPNVLVAGIKGQGLRIHDLRDQSHGPVAQFHTKCCNNLAIDYADQNYFASSALDQPGVMVWDRRAISRHDVNPSYAEALERDNLPWGGALRLDRAVDTETDPASMDSKSSFIRSLRFCRDHPGMLAVLSRTGQLRILSIRHEHVDADARVEGSPELLEVRRSYEMDPLYVDPGRKNDKIVSFDWITMSSPVLQPRMLVLRASGAFDVLEKPSFTAEYPFKLIPWQPPHRGLEGMPNGVAPKTDAHSPAENPPYQEVMEFEPPQSQNIFGPLLTEQALSDIALFGPDKADIKSLVEQALTDAPAEERMTVAKPGPGHLPAAFEQASSVADKLKALRLASKEGQIQSDDELSSQLERHEKLLTGARDMAGLSSKARFVLDHTMLLRAKEGYRFDYAKNQQIVADDPWLQDAWAWVAGAEEAAIDGGMMSHPLDLGYMGVHTIWTNYLGSRPRMRLSDGASPPDEIGWERCLNAINKKLGIPRFDGEVGTKRPHHREMCLEMCNWGRSYEAEVEEALSGSGAKRISTWYTMVAAHALFRGDTKGAVQVLKKASTEHPELLFVSLALQLIGKASDNDTKETLDFDEKVASRADPYLRAISSIIATGDWAVIANQRSLPLRDRCFVAIRNFDDDALTAWLEREVAVATEAGDMEGIVLTGITDALVDVLARYVHKFGDVQTATLLLSICAPRFIDDVRAAAMRSAYRAYLQRHRAFFLRVKFDVESTKRSKHQGHPTLRPAGRQIGLRCVYCDVEIKTESLAQLQQQQLSLRRGGSGGGSVSGRLPNFMPRAEARAHHYQSTNPFTEKMVAAGISCPKCKQHLPRCVVCLEVVGMPRSDRPELSRDAEVRRTARFPTFCVSCGHVLHLDHARQWFARHRECPVPECRCLCNTRVNEELDYA
ncbi:SEH-associated protein 4 [Madurella mycetomatis]|uniref:SEH-associated protein 4 n=1 Tax=Madurella mycetomatis TaxID=100816 RepID=A0A175VZ32_9PEZI|nr:SEH-associated protein 4 [Madurella mycetomatis]